MNSGGALPSVTVIVPTLDSGATLADLLRSLDEQVYAGALDVLCVDGGSVDATRQVAGRFNATVLDNEAGDEEEARALGVEAAGGELLLFLDADNELPHERWLERMVNALSLADDLVSADPLHHAWRRRDPPFSRLCGLIGGIDPLAVELGYSDRWATHLNRWTGLPHYDEEREEAVLVRIDPQCPPPMGSNGFLVRREEVLRTTYRPFVHSDVVGDLAELGWRFARARDSIVHHAAANLQHYTRKARRRARRAALGIPPQRRGFHPPLGRTIALVLSSWTFVGPAWRALRGFRRRPDPVWALYPVAYAIQTAAYALEMSRALLLRGHIRAPAGKIGRGKEPKLRDYPGLVSVVMPSYNEAGHLAAHVADTLAAMDELGCRHELIIVDDGSGDDTRSIAKSAAAADHRVTVVGIDENIGKGFALIHGARRAGGDLVLCVDADLEVHPRQLSILYETLVRERADVVIGSKLHPRARIEYPTNRRILSFGYYALVRVLFGLPVRDTQTGLKLYKREVLERVIPRLVVKRYAHDLEVLVNAHRLGYRIAEAPVVVTRKRDYPRIGGQDVRQVAQDTLAIWYRTYLLHYYDRHVEPLPAPPMIYRATPREPVA